MNKVMQQFNACEWQFNDWEVPKLLDIALDDITEKISKGEHHSLLGVTIKPPHKDNGLWVLGEIVIVLDNAIIGFRYIPKRKYIKWYKKISY